MKKIKFLSVLIAVPFWKSAVGTLYIIVASIFIMGTGCTDNEKENETVSIGVEKRFYYGFDEKIEINQMKNKVLVKTKPAVSKSQYEQLAKKRLGEIRTEWLSENLCKIELTDSEELLEKIKGLLTDDEVVSVRPYYKTNDGLELGLSDEIILKFKSDIKDSEKEKVLKKFSLQKGKTTKIYEIYHISKDRDIISAANELYESGLFEFAYPNLICKAELYEIPNDPYFQYQVALHNTGQTFNGLCLCFM
jgi:hypothetical protein